jgi:hypothetical protein
MSELEEAEERAEMLRHLHYELGGMFSAEPVEHTCDVCAKPLSCMQVAEYGNDGYDYLVCMECVKTLRASGEEVTCK